MKMKRRNTKYRSRQADAQYQSLQEANTKMKLVEEQAKLVAESWKRELRDPSAEFRFCKAIGRSLTMPCRSVTRDVYNNTIILQEPTIDEYADYNRVRVESVDFVANTITFEDEQIQSTWDQVKHLFVIQSLTLEYEVEKQRKGEYERWVIGDCLDNDDDFGFFQRIHKYEMDSECDHSAFISLCYTKSLELDLYRFDKSRIRFVGGETAETARLAYGTIKFIAIKPKPTIPSQ